MLPLIIALAILAIVNGIGYDLGGPDPLCWSTNKSLNQTGNKILY